MSNDTTPSLDDLTVLLAVIAAGGFRAAAKRLRLSPSHVSETVARVEADLGVPLLTRTTRSVTATEAGRLLTERVAPLLAEARAALRETAATERALRGRLKFAVPGAVMMDILPPLLDRFMRLHPGVRVEVVVEDRLIDLAKAECNAGIRYSEHLALDMIAVPLGPREQQLAYAATPAYLARRGTPQHPRDLLGHDCIQMRFASGALVDWLFERGAESLTLDPPARLIVSVTGVGAAIDLACAGHGVVATFRNWLDRHLAAGALVPVLEDWWPRFEGPWLYFPSRAVSPPLRAFLDMIAAER